ncbi:ABC transporter ATP-binding protein [Mycobacterium sp. KBS0706]|uniref:ABC transporter ATP-binding protein n=1 Tax=Mycobacterium sp. KBS0706 TaxID=2578109 RepID=UPI0027D35002|nr:oligopeptide/dipeptide ABC transporter ATP-binding protein [Mycobacterium sp. KBS0706]
MTATVLTSPTPMTGTVASPAAQAETILAIRNLDTRFQTGDGVVAAVNGISLDIAAGETLGVVGESGSGKSQLFMSVMGLLASNGRATGSVQYRGQEILGLPPAKLNRFRGSKMSMIFQDPMTSLNPYLPISRQMTEVLVQHKGMTQGQALKRSIEMLDLVRIPEAKRRIGMYPHEFSGGMRQRVMIAMALLCQPDLLIADEPTTALDVTVQAQILDLMRDLKREFNTSIVLITHDLGVIAGLADRVMVMYAGNVIETGSVRDIFYTPQHPYTEGLLQSMPRLNSDRHAELPSIGGQPPNLQDLPPGCNFQPRCRYAHARCVAEEPRLRPCGGDLQTGDVRRAKACHLAQLPLTEADRAVIDADRAARTRH